MLIKRYFLPLKLLVANSEALDDLQFNPTQIDVLTNVVGALAEVAKIQVILDFFQKCVSLSMYIGLYRLSLNDVAILILYSAIEIQSTWKMVLLL